MSTRKPSSASAGSHQRLVLITPSFWRAWRRASTVAQGSESSLAFAARPLGGAEVGPLELAVVHAPALVRVHLEVDQLIVVAPGPRAAAVAVMVTAGVVDRDDDVVVAIAHAQV